MASKRKPGASVPEAQRHTEQVKLRLPPDVAAELRRRAVEHPGGVSGVVAGLLLGQAEEVPKRSLVAPE